MIETKERILEFIAKNQRNESKKGMVLLLTGPPGVGKTKFAQCLAESLDIPFVQITLGGQNDGELLHGHGYTYSGSQPGLIVKKMNSFLKLIGFNEKYNQKEETETKENSKPNVSSSKSNDQKKPNESLMKSPLMQIKQLIKVLSTPHFDGRVLLTLDQSSRSTLKYILMNPSICFEEIASQAHSVILAGGTMKPVDLLS
jgi:ATP-dependent protease Clp ATPase subunit